jgi:hypothetical protein
MGPSAFDPALVRKKARSSGDLPAFGAVRATQGDPVHALRLAAAPIAEVTSHVDTSTADLAWL